MEVETAPTVVDKVITAAKIAGSLILLACVLVLNIVLLVLRYSLKAILFVLGALFVVYSILQAAVVILLGTQMAFIFYCNRKNFLGHPSSEEFYQNFSFGERRNDADPEMYEGLSSGGPKWPDTIVNVSTLNSEEAVKRILACQPKEYYNVIGVPRSATPEEIRKNFRRQGILCHPDKTQAEGAEDAFKRLNAANACLSDEQSRKSYNSALDSLAARDTLTKDSVEEMIMKVVNRLPCEDPEHCHLRVKLPDRSTTQARWCRGCECHHSGKEGQVWKETSHLGFKVHFISFMDGHIWDVTDWGLCMGLDRVLNEGEHMAPVVFQREAPPTGRNKRNANARDQAAAFEELLQQMFAEGGMPGQPPGGFNDFPHPPEPNGPSHTPSGNGKKKRKKKKR